MKNQALFSSKDKSKKIKCRLLQFLFGALKIDSLMSQQSNVERSTTSRCDLSYLAHRLLGFICI